MSFVTVEFKEAGNLHPTFCAECNKYVGSLDWSEISALAAKGEPVLCFGCERDSESFEWPTCMIMPLEEAWRLTIDGHEFYGEWGDIETVHGERFLFDWSVATPPTPWEIVGFIVLPDWIIRGPSWGGSPLSSCANLKKVQDDGDYCEA